MALSYDEWVIVVEPDEDVVRDGVPYNLVTKMIWLIEEEMERRHLIGEMLRCGVRVVTFDELAKCSDDSAKVVD